ncbi:MAG: hypothetical protein KJ858_05300, partial [Nanoarchaeota archaeon]|nr:hypothetical protein [Nanoarchaeota archaeon]
YGAINFTINEDYYEGILGGISIKDFRRWDINDSFDYLIMNRSLRYDPLYWEIGYTFFEELTKNGNEKVDGKIILVSAFDGTDPPKYYYEHGLYLEENTYEQRISSLESWRTTINDWKDTITNTLSNITDSITSLFTTTEDHEDSIDDHETRIVTLETQTPPDFNLSFSEYWKYLDFRTKEDIACGWGEDNELNLFKMQDLGASCEIDGGRCNCKEVNGECDIEEPLYCYSWELRRNDINLEIKNLAGEDLTIESIDVTNCGIYDRDYKLREGRDRTFRISCADDSFTGGDVTIQYKTESGESLSSTGIVVI